MNCNCADWKENIDKVNAPLLLAAARSGGSVQYDGVRFRFCPWCSRPLKESEADSVSNGNEKHPVALDKQNPVGSGSQKLSQLLDRIEERMREAQEKDHRSIWKYRYAVTASADDVPKLVKALRQTLEFMEWAIGNDEGLLRHRKNQVAAILTDSGEKNQGEFGGILSHLKQSTQHHRSPAI